MRTTDSFQSSYLSATTIFLLAMILRRLFSASSPFTTTSRTAFPVFVHAFTSTSFTNNVRHRSKTTLGSSSNNSINSINSINSNLNSKSPQAPPFSSAENQKVINLHTIPLDELEQIIASWGRKYITSTRLLSFGSSFPY
jgi:hypothetical protein